MGFSKEKVWKDRGISSIKRFPTIYCFSEMILNEQTDQFPPQKTSQSPSFVSQEKPQTL
jgi:hypothetical protein